MDAVYSTSNPLHLSALLKAVRTTYNIFLLSRINDNQNVAQITMTQMVDHIFRRVKLHPNVKEPQPQENQPENEEVAESDQKSVKEEIDENTVSNAPHETEADSTAYQQQIIVEANMARTEMNHKLPSGKSKDNYEDFLNDTANVFQDENQHTATNNNSNTASNDETR